MLPPRALGERRRARRAPARGIAAPPGAVVMPGLSWRPPKRMTPRAQPAGAAAGGAAPLTPARQLQHSRRRGARGVRVQKGPSRSTSAARSRGRRLPWRTAVCDSLRPRQRMGEIEGAQLEAPKVTPKRAELAGWALPACWVCQGRPKCASGGRRQRPPGLPALPPAGAGAVQPPAPCRSTMLTAPSRGHPAILDGVCRHIN